MGYALALNLWDEAAYYLESAMKEKREAKGHDVVMDRLYAEKVQKLPSKYHRRFKKFEKPDIMKSNDILKQVDETSKTKKNVQKKAKGNKSHQNNKRRQNKKKLKKKKKK